MKIIAECTDTPQGLKFTLNPEFIDILAQDPIRAWHIVKGLERFDREQYEVVMELFAVSGIQHTHDSLQEGETLQYCGGKRRSAKK